MFPKNHKARAASASTQTIKEFHNAAAVTGNECFAARKQKTNMLLCLVSVDCH